MGVEASINTSGVSSSRMSKSLLSDSRHCIYCDSPKLVLGVIGELRQRRELPDNWRKHPWEENPDFETSIHSVSLDENDEALDMMVTELNGGDD